MAFFQFSTSKERFKKSLKDGGYKGVKFFSKGSQTCTTATRSFYPIKCASIEQILRSCQGGNQQKLLSEKWIVCDPEVLIFDEPTRWLIWGKNRNL